MDDLETLYKALDFLKSEDEDKYFKAIPYLESYVANHNDERALRKLLFCYETVKNKEGIVVTAFELLSINPAADFAWEFLLDIYKTIDKEKYELLIDNIMNYGFIKASLDKKTNLVETLLKTQMYSAAENVLLYLENYIDDMKPLQKYKYYFRYFKLLVNKGDFDCFSSKLTELGIYDDGKIIWSKFLDPDMHHYKGTIISLATLLRNSKFTDYYVDFVNEYSEYLKQNDNN